MFNKGMMEKLQGMKQQAEEAKKRLDEMTISDESGGGLVRISMSGNRKLKSFEINADLTTIDKDDLEDLISVALDRVINKVNDINEKEMLNSAQSLFPGM